MQDTSIDAYHSSSRRSNSKLQCDRIVEYVERAGTATIAEIAKALGMEKSSVSARRNELIAAGRLVLAGERKCSVTNRTVQSVKLPARQGALFQ
ncbi:MarR family transcriptional regulator [Ralstonia mannitolilytica]|uniref:MarR family transcriptional regulator n=1 Tax=Ralstonia mannitolilytica TaxID=105219 RepID=UPI00215D9F60|nr:helix-turn-helix domain-containing protein [Ralstonia mannitolilytica]